LKIIVSDTGCGIHKEDVEKLFQKFTQVSKDKAKRKLGTGLGLFITKELCNRMDGEVKVFSKKNKGSSFICCIPAEPVHELQPTSLDLDSIKDPIMHDKLRAMVVDDDKFNHTVVGGYFQKLGISVIDKAIDGFQAYQKFMEHSDKESQINIVTMDLDMPVMDGKESARKIREFEVKNGLEPCLLIILSANCAESEINECLDPNGNIKANTFLKKPAKLEDMQRIIDSHLAYSNSKTSTKCTFSH